MATCFPSIAHTQFGNFHLHSKSIAKSLHCAVVSGVVRKPFSFNVSQMALQVSFTIRPTVVSLIR